jgi:myo-inositol-1-phosphate synthase
MQCRFKRFENSRRLPVVQSQPRLLALCPDVTLHGVKRLGICIAGFNGAVASTLVAGVALICRRLAKPQALISEQFRRSHGLARLEEIVFGGWDVRGENLFEAAMRNRVLEHERLHPITKELASLKPWRPDGGRASRRAEQFGRSLTLQIARFRRQHKLDSVVVLNLLPTGEHHASRQFALAAADTGCPFINFTPNDCGEAKLVKIPYCGRDGKTGQTWLKSVFAPAFRARGLRITGWYSTNLLGNEDGRVVSDGKRGKAKVAAKSKLLAEMLGYGPHHQVQIAFYPPRGDDKESWDAIDFEGFLGLPMQLKVNGLWRDSILAAPMCLDLARFMELAQRRGAQGPQTWLSLFFKSPYGTTVHEFHKQEQMLLEFLTGG